jgi:hypothetical protein
MTAKEIIELYVQSTSPQYADNIDGLDTSDPAALFKHQLLKGRSYKKDALRTMAPRDLNFNVDTDNSWMSSADKPWF